MSAEMVATVADHALTNRAANMVLDGGTSSTIALLFLVTCGLVSGLGYVIYAKLQDFRKQKAEDSARIDALLKQNAELAAQMSQVQQVQSENLMSLASAERDRFLLALKDFEVARDRALREIGDANSRDLAQVERAIEAIEKVLTSLRDAVRDQNTQLQATLIMGSLSAPMKGHSNESVRRD